MWASSIDNFTIIIKNCFKNMLYISFSMVETYQKGQTNQSKPYTILNSKSGNNSLLPKDLPHKSVIYLCSEFNKD